MSKHTVMAWNERHILVEHVLVDRATDDCDPVMSAVHRLQRALGAKDGDPRWQAWHGHAEVAVTAIRNAAPAILDELEQLRRENSKLRYAVHMDVSDDSYTHDNALADAIRERDEAVKRGGNEAIDHGATAGILIDAQKEITELRAYRDRTEAALLLMCNGITLNAMCGGPLGQLTSILRDAGLWRAGDA